MDTQQYNPFSDALALASGLNVSTESKRAVELGLRNSYGDYVLSGIYGQGIPPYMTRFIAMFRAGIKDGGFDATPAGRVPRRFGMGDIMNMLNPAYTSALDSWTLERLEKVLPVWHDAEARLQLERFYREYIHAHVIAPEKWTDAMTAMILVLLYSFEEPETRVHMWFASVLGQGIVPSLQRYQLDILARGNDAMPYDPMLTVAILRAVGNPPGIVTF